ncbi:MAG TPA: glycosyltransferase [Ilumatobacter sp.]|nr:glycosyltransferase [Ilumatobacter sp.]
MKVAHVVTKLDVGGAQTHVAELAIAQHASGVDVRVIAGVDGPAAARVRAAGISVVTVDQLGSAHGRFSQRSALVAVRDAIARDVPQIVHAHSSHAGLMARLAARRLSCRSVYTAHGWPFQAGAAWKQRIASFLGEFVGGHVGDAVICLTEAEADRARRARVVPKRRIWVVPNGIADVSVDLQRRGPVDAVDGPVMVMVARFAPPKLQVELLETLNTLGDLPWTLQLVGDGPGLQACDELVAASPLLSARVALPGHRDDVPEILAAADIGLLWSRYEGLPISVMEQMRAGLACVASDLPGTRALFGDEPAGVVAASSDELASALRGLMGDPKRVEQLGAAARRRYESAFSVDAMLTATNQVYAAVLEPKR